MANPILQQAIRRKLRESHAQGLQSDAIKMPQVKPVRWWTRVARFLKALR